MNSTFLPRKGRFEKTFCYVCRLVLEKKLSLTLFLVSSVILASFSQNSRVLLSRYDSCHVQPPHQNFLSAKALGAAPMVRVAYVIPSNRTPQPHGVANLQHAIKLAQQFFKEQMELNGFEPKTFTFETEGDGVTPLIHVVHVSETDEYLRGDLWGRTQQAASNAGISLWAPGEVWVVIPETYLMFPDGSGTGGVALGAGFGSGTGGGVSMIGSNALPLFHPAMITDDTPYNGKVLPELGPYPMKQDVTFAWFEGTTFSSVASSWLGALWHETGHAFGLGHDFRNDNNFHGNLMGNGLRGTRGTLFPEKYPQDYTRLEYWTALFFNVNHFFNTDKIETYGPAVSHSIPTSVTPQEGLVYLPFQASDPDGLSFAYLVHGGDMASEILLEGTTANATFAVPYFRQGDVNRYIIFTVDKQGNKTNTEVEFTVPAGNNQAPIPFIKLTPPVPGPNQSIVLDARQSTDIDHDPSSLVVSWDLNADGSYDIQNISINTLVNYGTRAGNHLIKMKVTDPAFASSISTILAFKIPDEKKIAVESFTLINADKDEAIGDLQEGMVIKLTELNCKLFSVRANTSAGTIDRVEFHLEGPISHHQTERKVPYALFGDSPPGNFDGKQLLPGEYKLTATPFSASSEKGIALTVSFKVIMDPVVASLTLMNAHTDQEIKELKDGEEIHLAETGRLLDVRANITANDITKVFFELNGPVTHQQTERQSPYALFGNQQNNFNGRKLLTGAYTLKVTPFIHDKEATAHTVSFTVTDGFGISSFTLVDATLDKPVRTLVDGDIIDLSLFDHHRLAVRADTEPTNVDKVDLALQGPVAFSNTERVYPYVLFGDITQNGSTDYNGGKLFPGNYAISATPYLGGHRGSALTIKFEIIKNGASARQKVEVYPIPASNVVNIRHEGIKGNAYIKLIDVYGNVLVNRPLSSQPLEQMDISSFRKGIHYLKISSAEGVQVIRMIIE